MNSAAVQSCAEVIKMFEKSSEEKKKFCISKYLQKKKVCKLCSRNLDFQHSIGWHDFFF